MTLFEQLKKDGVPGKTILVDQHDFQRYFMGFNPVNEKVLTVRMFDGDIHDWNEKSLSGWKIKKPMKTVKIDIWLNIYLDPTDTCGHSSRELADSSAQDDRIACEHFVKEYQMEDV